MKVRCVRGEILLASLISLIYLGCGFHVANAEEITVSNSIEAPLTSWVQEISVDKFDPNNGKLLEVHTTISSGLLGDVQYESLENNPAELRIGMEADILLHGADGNLIASTQPMTEVVRFVSSYDGVWDFAGTSGGHIENLIIADSAEADTVTDPAELQTYIGTDELRLGLSGNGRSYINGTGNLSSIFSLRAKVDVFITYVYEPPSIDIEKFTNGENADSEPGPEIEIGDPVVWEYVVENTGLNPLIDVVITDDQGVELTCPQSTLAPGEKMTCTGNGIATEGQYANTGTASGQPTTDDGTPVGDRVSDSDLSHYVGISFPGSIGDTVWLDHNQDGVKNLDEPALVGVTVRLYNAQGSELESAVTGEQGYLFENLTPGTYIIEVDASTLPENAIPTSDADGIDTPHQSRLTLQSSEANLEQDFGYIIPAIDIETLTNGDDADTPTGPEVPIGSLILWEYVVTNASNIVLVDVQVTDDQGLVISCPATELAAGATMVCTAEGTAESGQYKNVGSVVGWTGSPTGIAVTDTDPSHYFGIAPAAACPAELLPKVEFLGGTEVRGEAQKKFTLPEGFDVFLVKRTHRGPFRFDVETGSTTETGEQIYTTSWGKIERVWACAGNCTLTQAFEGSVEIGQAILGDTIHAVVIDDDPDDRHLWWAADESQNRVEQIPTESMTMYLAYEVPFDATWQIFSDDSIGIVSACIAEPSGGRVHAYSTAPNEKFVLPFFISPGIK